eukprot:sb/3474859/
MWVGQILSHIRPSSSHRRRLRDVQSVYDKSDLHAGGSVSPLMHHQFEIVAQKLCFGDLDHSPELPSWTASRNVAVLFATSWQNRLVSKTPHTQVAGRPSRALARGYFVTNKIDGSTGRLLCSNPLLQNMRGV